MMAPSSSCLNGLGVETTKTLGIVAVVVLVDIVSGVDVDCICFLMLLLF